jgi:hypothetical protein
MILAESSGAQDKHIWACRQTSGMLGETNKFTLLTPDQVNTVVQDPTKADEVCPGGQIVCQDCTTPFFKAAEQPQSVNYSDLKARVIKTAVEASR